MSERTLDRIAVSVLERISQTLWGFPPRIMAPVVAQVGPMTALSWAVRNMPRYERTLRTLGPLRTHLACAVVSLYNGCRYCSFGHLYAVELIYLQRRGKLFPLDARTVEDWIGLKPAELRHRMVDVLQRADLHGEVLWIDLTLALASGTQRAVDVHEARVAHLVSMYNVLNQVGISSNIDPDQAHDPINKNLALKTRHGELRASAA